MIVVGVDAGGSRTRIRVWRDGTSLGDHTAEAAALRPGRALQASGIIAANAKSALAQLGLIGADALVVGVAGAGRTADADALRVALRGEYVAERVMVTTDVALALASAPPEVAIVLLAGTGSIALARGADGTLVQQGGWGWQMGDEGSGYWIGREGLVAVGRAHDGRAPATGLTTALESATASPSVRELAGWAATASPREVATLAAVVVSEAERGDAAAQAIVARAVEELTGLVQGVSTRLRGPEGAVALGGGLLGPDRPLRQRVAAALEQARMTVWPAPVDALQGALTLAAGAT